MGGSRYSGTFWWRDLRQDILLRDNGICQYCGCEGATIDHVLPRSRGGLDHPDNLRACCQPCNSIAGDRVFATFAEKRTWILQRRGLAGVDK